MHLPPKIDHTNHASLKFFSEYFHCTEQELIDAIHKIGNCTEEVRIFLQLSSGSNQNLAFRLMTSDNLVK